MAHRAALAWLAVAYPLGSEPVLLAAGARWCDEAERANLAATVVNMELMALSGAVDWLRVRLTGGGGAFGATGMAAKLLSPKECKDLLQLAVEAWPCCASIEATRKSWLGL